MVERYSIKKIEDSISECLNSNGKILDLKYLKLKIIPSIIPENVEYLILANNKLKSIPDLSHLKNLKVLDLSFNYISKLPVLPENIEELNIRCNKIKNIDIEMYNIKRLDCAMNSLRKVIFKGEILNCSYNLIKKISSNNSLKKLYCNNNKINKLLDYPNLEDINCSNNNIDKFNNYPKLHTIVCDYNNIEDIPINKNLKFLLCNNNNIKKLLFNPNLKEVICDNFVKISKHYNISEKITIESKKNNNIIKLRFV